MASALGTTVLTNLPASAPPVKVMVASNSELSGKLRVLFINMADRDSDSE